jgi:hypothetical protein
MNAPIIENIFTKTTYWHHGKPTGTAVTKPVTDTLNKNRVLIQIIVAMVKMCL